METYAITLTIKPNHYKDDILTQYSSSKNEIDQCPYQLSLVCEFTKAHNLHFHGLVSLPKPKRGTAKGAIHNFFRKCKYLGFIYVVDLTDQRKWFQYCFKEIEVTKLDLDFAPTVIINNVDIFPHGIEILQVKLDNHDRIYPSKPINIEDLIVPI